MKKFRLSSVFALIHFVFFFGVFLLFIYWQFKTIKEFHDIELNNFFDQTNNVVNVLIDKQQKEIDNLVNYNLNKYITNQTNDLPAFNNTDFVFFTDGSQILNLDGFSLIVDVNIVAQKLKNIANANKIVNIKIDDKEYYCIVYKQKVVDENLGKVTGEVWGVILLNENQILLEDIRKNLKLKEIVLVDKNGQVVSSTIKKDELMTNIPFDVEYSKIFISNDDKFIYRKNNIIGDLDVIYLIDNHHYNNIYDKFMVKVWWVVAIFIILGILIYFLVKYFFIEKLAELKVFIEDSFSNKEATYKESNIIELDDISIVFNNLFKEFNQNKSFQSILIQTLPIPFFSKDKDLKYNEFNEAFLNMLGKTREDLINKGVYDIAPKDLADKYHQADLDLIEQKNQVYEARVVYADEKEHDVVFFKASIFNEKGDFQGILGVVVDITDTKNMQSKLEDLNKSLEKQVEAKTKELKEINIGLEKKIEDEVDKNRKKDSQLFENAKNAQMGEMIGNIAHQWRQPLSVISTVVSGMNLARQFGTLNDEDFEKKTQLVMRNIKYLSNTIDTFRDYIKEKNELKEVVLQDRIESSLSIIEATLQNHHIELRKDIEKEPIKYNLIQGELSQVLINLINNAKDALIMNERKSDKKWLKIGLEKNKNSVILYVEDNAGGVSENIKEKIFNPYFTTKHQSQGTGLGLHMSKDIIQKHFKGSLYVKNTRDGAKFIIELPLQS